MISENKYILRFTLFTLALIIWIPVIVRDIPHNIINVQLLSYLVSEQNNKTCMWNTSDFLSTDFSTYYSIQTIYFIKCTDPQTIFNWLEQNDFHSLSDIEKFHIAEKFWKQGYHDEAISIWRTINTISIYFGKLSRLAYFDGDLSTAIQYGQLSNIIDPLPNKQKTSFYESQYLLYRDGKYQNLNKAIQALENLVIYEPNPYYYRLGILYINTNQPYKAIRALEQASIYNYDVNEVSIGLGRAYMLIGNHKKAREHFYLISPENSHYIAAQTFLAKDLIESCEVIDAKQILFHLSSRTDLTEAERRTIKELEQLSTEKHCKSQ